VIEIEIEIGIEIGIETEIEIERLTKSFLNFVIFPVVVRAKPFGCVLPNP